MSNIPTSNLELWLNFGLLTNDTTIPDSAGKNNSWIINNCTLIENGLNNLSTLRFSGNSSITPPASVPPSFFNFLHNGEGHVFLIAKMPLKDNNSPTSANYLLLGTYDDGDAGPGYRLYLGSSTRYDGSVMTYISRGSAGTYCVELLSLGNFAEGSWNLVHIFTDPTATLATNRGYISVGNETVNNNKFNLSANNNNSQISFRILGVDSDNSGDIVGELAELAIYKGQLSSSTIADIKTAMVTNWGLPIEVVYPTPTPTPTITPTNTVTPTVTPTPSVTPSSPPPQFFTGSSNGLDIKDVLDFSVDADSMLLYAIKDSNTIDVINLFDNNTTDTISIVDTSIGAQFNSVRVSRGASFRAKVCAINSVTNRLYVASRVTGAAYRSAISVIDLNTRTVIDTITGNDFGYATKMIISEKQNKLFLMETYGNDSVIAVDLETNTYTTLSTVDSRGRIATIRDIALDDTNDKLYCSASLSILQFNTTNNSLIGSTLFETMNSLLVLPNNRLAFSTDTHIKVINASTLIYLFSYRLSDANRSLSSSYGPYSLSYNEDSGTVYAFPKRALSNQTKVLIFDVNNYAFKGIYNFPGKLGSSGVTKAKFSNKLKKNIAMHPDSGKLYVISPDQLISKGSFDSSAGISGTCTNSFTKEGYASNSLSSLGTIFSPWNFNGGVKVASMSFCNRRDSYNAFVSMGSSSNQVSRISQSFNTVVGAPYTVEFSLGNAPGFNRDTPRMVRVRIKNGNNQYDYDQLFSVKSILTGDTYNSLGWEKRSFDFVASHTSTTIWFEQPPSTLSQGGAAIDNVYVSRSTYQDRLTITPTPTPQAIDSGLSYLQNNFTPATNIGVSTFISASNDYSSGKSVANIGNSFAGAVVRGSVVYLIPYNSSVIGRVYPRSNMIYSDGVAHGMGSQAFFGGTTLGLETIFMCPHKANAIGLYNTRNNTFTLGPEVTSFNYAGCVKTNNNKIVLVPYNADTVDVYDIATNTIITGPTHGGPNAAFMGGVLMSNNKVLLVPHGYGQVGIYDPLNNTYSGINHSDGTFIGGVLSANNNKVILIPHSSEYVGIYDIVNNTYTRGDRLSSTSHSRGTAAFAGGVLMRDGKILMIPHRSRYLCTYDVDSNNVRNLGRSLPTLNDKFLGGVLLSDGTVLLCPYKYTSIGLVEPPVESNIPANVIESAHINKF